MDSSRDEKRIRRWRILRWVLIASVAVVAGTIAGYKSW